MPNYLKFRINLMMGEGAPWREFLLSEDATFNRLHDAIQRASDWQCCHMYQFHELKKQDERGFEVGNPLARMEQAPDFGESEDVTADTELRVGDYFKRKGKKCLYNYDFGDDWWVGVEYQGAEEANEKFKQKLLNGAGAWPPDDFGGPYAWEDFLYALKQPKDKLDEDLTALIEEKLEWMEDMGIEFDPEEFDLERAKKAFDLK
jgi:hypothetical protein